MRNIPIPIDTLRLTFAVVTAPRPRLVSQETGEIKTDKSGRTVYMVGMSAADANGRVELVNVNVSGEPLVGFSWEQVRNGQLRWGIAYRAESITAVTAGTVAA